MAWKPTQLEQAAMDLAATPGWYPWIFEKTEDAIHCTGAVCPLHTSGIDKGTPNYRKADPATKRVVVVPRTRQPAED